jgi:D-alanine-D-alanine ligase-like ATP-grasp enzyme
MGGPDPDRFHEGWFYTGDLAEWTPDGQLVHCGRADQLMIMNGINIYPAEIERVIGTHPAVREVLAFPFAHHIAQDLPVCVVVLNDAATVSPEEIQSYAHERLGLKSPRHVVILPSIPRNEQGKPARAQLNQFVRLSLQKSLSKSGQASTGTNQPNQRRQRSRRIQITLSPPNFAQADLVRPWRSLLTNSTTLASAGMPVWKTPADEAFAAWLTELLLIAAELLRMVRVPVFDPLVPFKVQQLSPSANAKQASWQAVLEVPVLDHMPTEAPEPVMAAAIQSSFRIALWTQQQAVGSSADADKRAEFFARAESEANTHLAKLAPTAGKSTLNVLAACHALGVPWADLGGDIYQLGWGARGRRIDRSTTEHDSAMGLRVTRNKAWTGRMLRSAGLPAAEHEMVHTVAQALTAGNRMGWPVVIKPVDAERGEGVRVDVQPAELEAAFTAAQKRSPTRKVLLERQVSGICHRIFIAQNQLLYAVRRLPIGVYGNGTDSIEKLVNDACALELTKAPWLRSPLKPIDDLAHQELARQGLRPDSVPAAGRFVGLRRIESSAWGGVDEDVTREMHPENLRIALDAARLCGLDVAGVDVISPDISQAWHTNGAVINEINYAPLLGEGLISRAHIPQYLAQLLSGHGRIPVDVFVGDAAATTAARKKATLLHQQGTTVVVTSHDWTFWGHGQELVLAVNGLYARTRALILSRKIEALILVVQNDELSYSGLPLEGVDRVEIVNQNLACRAPLNSVLHQHNLLQRLAAWQYG